MNKPRGRTAVIWLIWLLILAPIAAAGMELRQVAVREGALRQDPMPFGRVLAILPYGEPVEVLAGQGSWFRVRNAAREGWMHHGSLIAARLYLQAGSKAGVAASRDELALGGKGFSPEVEASYRAGRRDVDYTFVDRMEQIGASPAEMQQFLAQGGLKTGMEESGHAK